MNFLNAPTYRLALTVALLAPCIAIGAGPQELSVAAEGAGGVSRQGATPASVSKVELSLKPDGQFILTLSGDDRYQFRGGWEAVSDDRIMLTVSQAFGAAAGGQGVAMLRRERLSRIGLGGQNDQFSASFSVQGRYTDFVDPAKSSDAAAVAGGVSAPRPGRDRPQAGADAEVTGRIRAPRPGVRATAPPPPPPPAAATQQPAGRAPLRVTVEGVGSFAVAEAEVDDRRVDAMEVFLNADESLHLKMFGPGFTAVLGGSWRRTGAGPGGTARYRLTIRSGFDAGRTTGQGTLLEKDGRVVAIALTGSATALQSDWRLDFRQR